MTLSFYVISLQREFYNRKNSGVREEVSDVNKSLCKNILFVSSRLCTSPLVRAPPQLTLFTSPTTPLTPRHVRSIQFRTLDILQSPVKFTGKSKGNAVKEHYSQISCSCVIYLVDGAQSKCKRKC